MWSWRGLAALGTRLSEVCALSSPGLGGTLALGPTRAPRPCSTLPAPGIFSLQWSQASWLGLGIWPARHILLGGHCPALSALPQAWTRSASGLYSSSDPQCPHRAWHSERSTGCGQAGSGFFTPSLAGISAGSLTSGHGFLNLHPQELLLAPLSHVLVATETATRGWGGLGLWGSWWCVPIPNTAASWESTQIFRGAMRTMEGRRGDHSGDPISPLDPWACCQSTVWPSPGLTRLPSFPTCLETLLAVPRART